MKNQKASPRLKFITLLLVAATTAFCNFEVSPFVLKLNTSRGELSGWIEIKPNQDKRPVAIELTLQERKLNLDGIEDQNAPESNDLTVYPSELVVYPGEKTKVQVMWSGKMIPTVDRAYTLYAKEVPIDLNASEQKDKVEFKFNTLVRYRIVVAIETGKRGNLSVVSTKKIDKNQVEIIVENKSAGRIPMDGFHLIIGGKKYTDFKGIGNAIMPGDQRRFILPMETVPSAGDIRFGAADMPIK